MREKYNKDGINASKASSAEDARQKKHSSLSYALFIATESLAAFRAPPVKTGREA